MKARLNKTTQALIFCGTLVPTVYASGSLPEVLGENFDQEQRYIVTLKKENQAVALPFKLSPMQAKQLQFNRLQSVADDVAAEAVQVLPSINAVSVELTLQQRMQIASRSDVVSIEVDPKRHLLAESTPYGIGMVQANQLSDNMSGNRKVCIMDTGYTLNHPDLPSTGITGDDGYGSNDTGNWYNDGNGHGTHVAGTIAAIGGNGQGVVGVNPSGQLGLHIVKVFNDSGRWAYGSDLIKAIEQCQQAGANITSMSLGGSGQSSAERQAFANSYAQGMLHIAAAGNDGNSSMSYPASYDAVVSVAAVDSSESKASFSQYNSQVEIAAPGVNVNSTWNNNGYKSISGTSMATPHVSGVAALVWSHFPNCSNQQVRDALNATAKDKGSAGRDTSYGYGIVQAKAAYDYLANSSCGGGTGDTAPVASFTAAVNGKTVQFTDGSSDDKGISSYAWQFGDGATSSQQNPSHTYSGTGDFTVKLTVTDTAGQTASKSSVVSITDGNTGGCNGVAAWSATKSYRAGDKVSYNGYQYEATWWSTGAQPNVFTNVWKKLGKCSGSGGGDNQAPVSAFSFNTNGLSVSFTQQATDDKGVASYAWNFGDGRSSSLANPSHSYAQAGSYSVSLEVTDAEGLSHRVSKTVNVSSDSNAGCNGVPAWTAGAVFLPDAQTSLNGRLYQAKWWNQGQNPEQFSGPWDVWTDKGLCQQ
ncbi:alkaline serine protease [Pseudoalteromonas phenolica]|uniref:Alkaline serine protease n=1 Tax=Pseudoalteromonas phenolica TaxID=161398 RepID=A0A4Q7IK94_9GAMM|nr:alkaline serine protease [Pseudoalteromonas phenolica]TMP84005.1 alkaline serine protease [Pseudoalteromonas phenolica]